MGVLDFYEVFTFFHVSVFDFSCLRKIINLELDVGKIGTELKFREYIFVTLPNTNFRRNPFDVFGCEEKGRTDGHGTSVIYQSVYFV